MKKIADWDKIRKEGRGKIIHLSEDEILDFVITHEGTTRVKRISLPDNWNVHSVYPDYERQSFAIIVFSDEFNHIPRGARLPEMKISKDLYIWVDVTR